MKGKYTAFLKSAYEGISSRKGNPPSMVIVHPKDFQDVLESLAEAGLNLVVIEDTETRPGCVAIGFGSPEYLKSN